MRHWLGLVVAGCALVAIEALPLQAPKIDGGARMSPAEQRAAELGSEIRWTHALLKRLRWQDSLPALLEGSAVDGVAVGGPPEVGDSMLDAIRSRLIEERDRLAPVDPDVLFGYYIQPRDLAAEPGVPIAPLIASSPEILAGEVGGRPYCILVHPVSASTLRHPELLARWLVARPSTPGKASNLLLGCRSFVQFGAPGPRIRAWLQDGAEQLATSWDQGHSGTGLGLGLGSDWAASGAALWFRWGDNSAASISLRSCLAGRADACLAQAYVEGGSREAQDGLGAPPVTGSWVVSRSAFLSVGGEPVRSFAVAGPYLFSDLQNEFGPEAFRHFWQSDQDVRTAFRDAFGEDMGGWLIRWTERNLPAYRAGPSLAASTLLGSVLLLTLLGAIAAAWAARRAVA